MGRNTHRKIQCANARAFAEKLKKYRAKEIEMDSRKYAYFVLLE